MGIRKKIALRAAMKSVEGIKKEDLLIPLKEEIGKQGLSGGNKVDAAMRRIEASGMKPVFDKLGITKEDIEEAFRE